MNPLDDPVAQEEFHRGLLCTAARGHRQRAGAAIADAGPSGGGSPLYSHNLVMEWCYGLSSAQHTNKHALLAHSAGARGGYLEQLRELGSCGRHQHNCAADMTHLIQKILGTALIPIYVCLVPFFISRSSNGQRGSRVVHRTVSVTTRVVHFLVQIPPRGVLFEAGWLHGCIL